jgi:hypothetical protein
MTRQMQCKPVKVLIGLACVGLLVSAAVCCAAPGKAKLRVAARHLESIPCRETGADPAFSPLGLSFGLAGELYVVDSDNSLVFTLPDSLRSMTLFSRCPDGYDDCRLVDVGIGSAGEVLVSERTSGSLLIYDRWGSFVADHEIGEGLTGMDTGTSGKVYAAMSLSGTVRIIDPADEVEAIDCVISDDPAAYPVDCLITRDGGFVVTDPASAQVLLFGPLGQYKGRLGGFPFERPFGLAAQGDSLILVSDSDLGLVAVFASDGEFRGTFGQGVLKMPTFVACRNDGIICVADTEAMAIGVFRLDAMANE